ncbi:hypothetical protein BV25DRAFT_1843762, partial [Artomyces pyxidatus]
MYSVHGRLIAPFQANSHAAEHTWFCLHRRPDIEFKTVLDDRLLKNCDAVKDICAKTAGLLGPYHSERKPCDDPERVIDPTWNTLKEHSPSQQPGPRIETDDSVIECGRNVVHAGKPQQDDKFINREWKHGTPFTPQEIVQNHELGHGDSINKDRVFIRGTFCCIINWEIEDGVIGTSSSAKQIGKCESNENTAKRLKSEHIDVPSEYRCDSDQGLGCIVMLEVLPGLKGPANSVGLGDDHQPESWPAKLSHSRKLVDAEMLRRRPGRGKAEDEREDRDRPNSNRLMVKLVATMLQFPSLPATDESTPPWSHNVCRAHTTISAAYSHAQKLLHQEDGDPLRLRAQAKLLEQDILPLLEALVEEVKDHDWMQQCGVQMGCTLRELDMAADARQDREGRDVFLYNPITVQRSGGRGRPRKLIDETWLREAFAANLGVRAIASMAARPGTTYINVERGGFVMCEVD